jgi:hypothetical protein
MKTHEKWALAVASVAVLSPFLDMALASSLGSQPWANSWWWGMLGNSLTRFLTHVAVALWLCFTALRDGRSPFVWLALGAVFSLLAAILYFLLRALERAPTDPQPPRSAA